MSTKNLITATSKDGVYKVTVHHDTAVDDINILQIENGNQVIKTFTDNGEPEDNFFTRDYMWIADALVDAYNAGYANGEQVGLDEGRIAGHSEGYDEGYTDGYDCSSDNESSEEEAKRAYQEGYEEGYREGQDDASEGGHRV